MTTQEIIAAYIPRDLMPKTMGNLIHVSVPSTQLPSLVANLYNQPNLSFKLAVATEESRTSWNIRYIFSIAGEPFYLVPTLTVIEPRFPSVAALVPPASLYERL